MHRRFIFGHSFSGRSGVAAVALASTQPINGRQPTYSLARSLTHSLTHSLNTQLTDRVSKDYPVQRLLLFRLERAYRPLAALAGGHNPPSHVHADTIKLLQFFIACQHTRTARARRVQMRARAHTQNTKHLK